MAVYVALLRGINVGGNNIIKMTELKSCFEGMGLSDVSTYIQSGNVLFQSQIAFNSLPNKIEKTLSQQFKYKSTVAVFSLAQLKNIVEKAPKGFGVDTENYRYDVIFLKKPVTPKEVLKVMKTNTEVDKVFCGKQVLYISRLIERSSQSRLSQITKHPFYRQMTIRNWNTTTKLLGLAIKSI